jgi:hypothetical protein
MAAGYATVARPNNKIMAGWQPPVVDRVALRPCLPAQQALCGVAFVWRHEFFLSMKITGFGKSVTGLGMAVPRGARCAGRPCRSATWSTWTAPL